MTSEHLKDNRRHNIITASQAWSAVYERQKLWREKTFRAKPFEGNEMTQWGNENEHIALSEFESYMNDIGVNSKKLLVHPDLPIGGTPDLFMNGVVVEAKCPYTQKVYSAIPDRYYTQMQIQMCVAQANGYKESIKAHFVVWTPEEFHTEIVKYSPEFIDWYIPKAEEFLGYVATDKEPPRYKRKPDFNFNKGEK